jgi:phage shock protein PspC (stress-responsive transcriptional regulator)
MTLQTNGLYTTDSEAKLHGQAAGGPGPAPAYTAPAYTTTDATAGEPATRRLYRHPTAGDLGGVCAGLADSFGWDVTLVRVLWVVATLLTSGAGFLVYLLLWLLLPVGTQAGGRVAGARLDLGNGGGARLAIGLLLLGGVWLLSNLGLLPDMDRLLRFSVTVLFWPLLLMGLGYWLLRQNDPQAVARLQRRLRAEGEGLPARAAAWRAQRSQPRTQADTAPAADRIATSPGARPLVRSRSDRMVLGVAGGMAQWLAIDPVIMRLLWALLILATAGSAILLYALAALLLPQEGSQAATEPQAERSVGQEAATPLPQPAGIAAAQPLPGSHGDPAGDVVNL